MQEKVTISTTQQNQPNPECGTLSSNGLKIRLLKII
jgi:hypothetical protein